MYFVNNVFISLFLLMLIGIGGETFAAGTAGGGGGTLEQPTAKEVIQAIKEVTTLDVIEKDYADGHHGVLSPLRALSNISMKVQVSDSAVKSLLNKMTTDAVLDDIGHSPILFQRTGPCLENGTKPKQASVKANVTYSEICYSIPMLRELPKSDLKKNIIVLTYHEMAHHFGANEILAKKVENLYAKWVSMIQPLTAAGQLNALAMEQVRSLLTDLSGRNSNLEKICAGLGNLHGISESFSILVDNLLIGQEFGYAEYGLGSLDTVSVAFREVKMLPYCGIQNHLSFDPQKGIPFAELDDNETLLKQLRAEMVALLKAKAQLPLQQDSGGFPPLY